MDQLWEHEFTMSLENSNGKKYVLNGSNGRQHFKETLRRLPEISHALLKSIFNSTK